MEGDETYLWIHFGVIASGARQSTAFTVLPVLESEREGTRWKFNRMLGADLSTLRNQHTSSQIVLIDTKYYSDTLTVHLSIKTPRIQHRLAGTPYSIAWPGISCHISR